MWSRSASRRLPSARQPNARRVLREPEKRLGRAGREHRSRGHAVLPGDKKEATLGAQSDLNASVRIEAEDRAGIERLVRYRARPPFALERLHALDSSPALEGRLIYRFPKPDVHGRTELLLTPLELLEALAKFVPPPRVHRHRYHGVLAPNARLRPHVVALGRPELVSEAPAAERGVASPSLPSDPAPAPAPASPTRVERPRSRSAKPGARSPRETIEDRPGRGDRRSIRWAVLLARMYDVLPLLCPACGGEMRILAFLTDPPVVSAILLHLDPGPPRNVRCVG